MATSNPTAWPHLEITLDWLRQFDLDAEVWKLPAGGYYAGDPHDLWMMGEDEAAEEATLAGYIGDLIREYEALEEAESTGD